MAVRQDNTAAQLVAGHVKPTTTPDTATTQASVQDAIAAEAHALWAERGYRDGYDIDDWLEAERRLRGDDGPQGASSASDVDVSRAR